MSEEQTQGALLNVRVLDRKVVDDLADRLQKLIVDAHAAVAALHDTTHETDRPRPDAGVAEPLDDRIESAARDRETAPRRQQERLAELVATLGTTVEQLAGQTRELLVEASRGDAPPSPALVAMQTEIAALRQRVEGSTSALQQQLDVQKRMRAAARAPAPTPPDAPEPPAPRLAAADTGLAGLEGTAIGEHIRGFVEAVNSGDADAVRSFVLAHYAPSAVESVAMEQRLNVYGILYNRSHGIDVRFVRRQNEHEATLFAQARTTGAWSSYLFRFDETPPHGILTVHIDPLTPEEVEGLRAG